MNDKTDRKVAYSEAVLKKRVADLGTRIAEDYRGKELVLVGILKGAVVFLCDLAREIDLPVTLDMISIGVPKESVGKAGGIQITRDLDTDITNKHVLIIEDVIRSGLTTGFIINHIECKGAASIQVCTLLLSEEEKLIKLPIKYAGFLIGKTRLIGYGLDVNELGRNLPQIEEIE